MIYDIKLSQLLVAKLCHDFAGIGGAIDNCSDLLITTHDIALCKQAVELIASNAQKLTKFLILYRYAYTTATNAEQLQIAYLQDLIHSCLELERHQIQLQMQSGNLQQIDISVGQCIICCIIMAYEHIINKGVIQCDIFSVYEDAQLVIKAISDHCKIDQNKVNILLGNSNNSDINIFNCHEYYTYGLMQQLQCTMSVVSSNDSISYHVTNKLWQNMS